MPTRPGNQRQTPQPPTTGKCLKALKLVPLPKSINQPTSQPRVSLTILPTWTRVTTGTCLTTGSTGLTYSILIEIVDPKPLTKLRAAAKEKVLPAPRAIPPKPTGVQYPIIPSTTKPVPPTANPKSISLSQSSNQSSASGSQPTNQEPEIIEVSTNENSEAVSDPTNQGREKTDESTNQSPETVTKPANQRSGTDTKSTNQKSGSVPRSTNKKAGSGQSRANQEPPSGSNQNSDPSGHPTRSEDRSVQKVVIPDTTPTEDTWQAYRAALAFNQHRRAPKFVATGIANNPTLDKCNTCKARKPKTQSWADHNISEGHIKSLITQRGYGKAVTEIEKLTTKFVQIQCDLCSDWFKSKVLYNAHKLGENHLSRKRTLDQLLNTAYAAKAVEPWNRLNIKDIPPSDISEALKYQKRPRK